MEVTRLLMEFPWSHFSTTLYHMSKVACRAFDLRYSLMSCFLLHGMIENLIVDALHAPENLQGSKSMVLSSETASPAARG